MLRIGRAVLVATLVLAPAVWAQGPGSKFGAIVGGATLSDFGGDFGGSTGSRWGGTAGLLLGYNAWRTAITLEGDWVQKGGEDTRLDYIEFPLTVGAVAVTGGGAMRATDLQRHQLRLQGELQQFRHRRAFATMHRAPNGAGRSGCSSPRSTRTTPSSGWTSSTPWHCPTLSTSSTPTTGPGSSG